MAKQRYRVAQWATGNVGLRSLRAIIEHPLFELVAVRVYSPAKVGMDAGALCGTARTGIIATASIEEIIAAKPDCVVYMADHAEIPEMCRLLEAGINIATSLAEFNHRDSISPDTSQRLEQACGRGGSSLYASGSTPGYSTEIILFALTSIMRRVDCVTQSECADLSSRNSPEMLFDLLGFGRDPATIGDAPPLDPTTGLAPSLRMAAAAMGKPLDDVTCSFEYATARAAFDIPAGHIKAGTIAAIRMEISGMHQGTPFIQRRATWYLTTALQQDWNIPGHGWHYLIEGDTPLDVTITHPVSEAEYPNVTPGFTAHPVVNAVPFVCDAAPGIRHTSELSAIIGYFGDGKRPVDGYP
jgi:4-hydroxy-tetrahydrodipicolinate reductase